MSVDIKNTWRLRLEYYCKKENLGEPQYTTFSDRRGARTAWSCQVLVAGKNYAARYFFDGDYLQNAMEDAAEVALKVLDPDSQVPSRGPPSGSVGYKGA